jgi:CheY-like chemotaxis protein
MTQPASSAARPLVLVVDDSRTNSLVAQAVLERCGYRSQVARSGGELREQLKQVIPDVILMDIQLPDADGLSLTREVKGTPATAGIPIVALTSRGLKEDEAAAREAGCDAYLVKPINADALTRTLVQVRRESCAEAGEES